MTDEKIVFNCIANCEVSSYSIPYPPAQPDVTDTNVGGNLIDRRAALDALADAMPSLTTPDGCGQFDHDIQVTDEAYVDCMRIIHDLPSAQPTGTKTVQVDDCISRAEAIEALESLTDYVQDSNYENGETLLFQDSAIEQIKALPSAQPGWIPWDSGRFPEESGTYTVTAYDGAKRRVTYAKYQKRLKRWELTGARAYWRVLAWQPQLQPWEGGQDGTD